MTVFEIIILTIIYLVCYGCVISMFIKNENIFIRIFLAIIILALSIFAPLMFDYPPSPVQVWNPF